MRYVGKERRIHKVFVTRNTEYHVRGETCVAVKDRRSGQWLRAHLALAQKLAGGLRFQLGGGIVPNTGIPEIGESLYFAAGGKDLVTSAILTVDRPPKDIVAQY
ncbi:MAG: hypothetical protein IT379_25010 [Deltaproteobacteria bacterium]|nr:hypothetical protein [Deltaproteobacteria bacterium]